MTTIPKIRIPDHNQDKHLDLSGLRDPQCHLLPDHWPDGPVVVDSPPTDPNFHGKAGAIIKQVKHDPASERKIITDLSRCKGEGGISGR